MSVVDGARWVDALWDLRDVLRAQRPGLGLGMAVRLLEEIRSVLCCDMVCGSPLSFFARSR